MASKKNKSRILDNGKLENFGRSNGKANDGNDEISTAYLQCIKQWCGVLDTEYDLIKFAEFS